jgi:hypothetical protein
MTDLLDAAQIETEAVVERLGLRELLRTPETFRGHVRATDQIRQH